MDLVRLQLETSEEFVLYPLLERSHDGISVALRASASRGVYIRAALARAAFRSTRWGGRLNVSGSSMAVAG